MFTYIFFTIVKERHARVKQERTKALKSFKRYKKLDLTLNLGQHEEFLETVATITQQCPKELSQVLCEADAQGKGEVIKKIWKHDVEDRLAFKKDQIRNGTLCRSAAAMCYMYFHS